jgi:hypothetical protein
MLALVLVYKRLLVGSMFLVGGLCCSSFYFSVLRYFRVLFVFVVVLHPILSVSLDCPSVFFNVYLLEIETLSVMQDQRSRYCWPFRSTRVHPLSSSNVDDFLHQWKKNSRMCCNIVMVLCLHSSTSKMSNYWEIKCFQNLLIWEDTYEQWPKEKGHITIYKTLHRKIPGHLNSSPVFSGVRIARLCFVDRCLSFYLFFFWSLYSLSSDNLTNTYYHPKIRLV